MWRSLYACATECEKHSDMEHCKECADACRKCAAECKAMLEVVA
jgi:HD superfamily phosphodiesterase